MVKPAEKAAFAEHVVERIRRMLSQGILKPGDKLPGELEFARKLKISRSGLRSGIRLLKAMGVVETRLGLGHFVTASPPALELEPLTLLTPLQSFSPEETFLARRLLEVGLAGLAAKNATGDDLASMAEEISDMYASLEDGSDYFLHDLRFHRALARAAGNPVLATLTDMVSAVLYDVRRATVEHSRDLRPSAEMHRKIYFAIRAGNVDQARAAMSEHLFHAEQDIRLDQVG